MANLSNINNKFLVTTGGNVLIGQTSVVGSSILQVTGNATFAGDVTLSNGALTVYESAATSPAISATSGWGGGVSNPIINFGRVGSAVAGSIGYDDPSTCLYIGTTTSHKFKFRTNNVDAITIDTSQKVGIGTNVLNGKLSVAADDGTTTPPLSSGIYVGPYQGNTAVGSAWSYSNSGYTYTDFSSRYNSSDSYMRFIMKASATPVYAMTIRGDGRVGIGTTTPTYNLVVSNGGASGVEFAIATATGLNEMLSYNRSTSVFEKFRAQAKQFEWYTDATANALVIQSGGNVGIATATPQKKLHIEGTGGASEMQILVSSASDTVGHTAGIGLRGEGGEADGDFRIKGGIFFERIAGSFGNGKMILAVNSSVSNTSVTVADHALTIDTNKYVGIGTTSPSQKLDVQGNVNINGTVVEEGSGNNKTFRYRTPNSASHSGGNALITFGRFYWTPAHWVSDGPVLEVTLQCKYYSGYQRKYIIKAGYGDNEVIVNELQPSSSDQKITLQVGTKTAAGYNYAGQPVYYVDLQWTQTAYMWGWAQLSQQVSFLTANPTSGWGGVVVYSALSQNNNAGTPQNYSSFFNGNVGIGTGSPTSQLFVNNTADGDKIRWGRSNALVGSVGTYNGVPYIGYQGGGGGGIMFNGLSIEPTALGSARSSNTNDIGSASYKWKNVYLGGGIYLGGTATANKLDNYAEGTWTPTLEFGGNTAGITYGGAAGTVYRGGHYTRVGRVVTFSFRIILTSKGTSTGEATITGLPFVVANLAGNYGSAMWSFANNFVIPERSSITIDNGSSIIRLRFTNTPNGNYGNVTSSDFNNNSDIILTGTYQAAPV